MNRTQVRLFTLVILLLLSVVPAWPGQSHTRASLRHKNGFGSPQVITGMLSGALPAQNLLMMRVYDPKLTAQALSGIHRTVRQEDKVSQSDEVSSAVQTPSEAEYEFKVNSSTAIRIEGQAATLVDLASLAKRRAKVRFVPYRTGNVALRVDVGG